MEMQQRSFTSRVSKRKDNARKEGTKIRLELKTELEQEDGSIEVTFAESYTFTKPTEERLFLMATAFGAAAQAENAASEVDATLRAMLLDRAPVDPAHPKRQPPSEYDLLRQRIDGPVEKRIEIEDLMEIIGVLTEEWAEGFPTQSSTGSPGDSPTTTGRSTGRVYSEVGPASSDSPSTTPYA